MRAGRLRHRVRVERPISTQSSSGAETRSWSFVVVIWAQVSPITARQRERLSGSQFLADMDVMIITRWCPALADIDPTWRAVFGNRIYNFVGISNVDMRNKELEIFCRTGDNSG